jgi:predicted short-subunit dehydrogenase-like oxidoreductase (DUF2520 family)
MSSGDMGADDVVIVGAGRVGMFLAARLAAAGRVVTGVVVRSEGARRRAAALDLRPLALADDAVDSAGTLLLSVADDDLDDLVRQLVQRGRTADRFVAHTSGRFGVAVLSGLTGPVAAIHPAMTFTGGPADLGRAGQIVYAVTADGEGLTRATALVDDLGGRVELVAEQARPAYHAAMSHAANHLVTLIADAADLLSRAGIQDTSALLEPITTAALANVLAVDPATGGPAGDAALTGPVVRGDVGTVAAHLAALAGDPAQDAYRAMARRTAQRALASGRLTGQQAQSLLDLIADA